MSDWFYFKFALAEQYIQVSLFCPGTSESVVVDGIGKYYDVVLELLIILIYGFIESISYRGLDRAEEV